LDNTTLILALNTESALDQRACLILISRELLNWPKLPVQALEVQGMQSDQSKPVWDYRCDLTDRISLSGLAQCHSPSPLSLPASYLQPYQPLEEFSIPIQRLDRGAWNAVIGGGLLAMLLILLPFLTFLFVPLMTLIHELGHAFMAWVFGYPAIPAFDFLYGGGMTIHGDRWPLLLWAIYGGLGYLAWVYRRNRMTLIVLGIFTAFYSAVAFSSIHQVLFVAMGHGFELIFAGVFLYRAISGFGCRNSVERLLYGMAGFFIIFYDLRFAWRLIFDPMEVAIYRGGKGGLLDHDFVRLSQEFFHLDLAIIIGVFWWLVLFTPIFILFLHRYQQLMLFTIARLFMIKSD
jgi:hypothetical protein